jgi:hypothetical protein
MALFITRVELHDASDRDYEALHTAMAGKGFARTISDDSGLRYRLPTAEYSRTASVSIAQILADAKAAAQTTGRRHSVLVSECARCAWDNLPRA